MGKPSSSKKVQRAARAAASSRGASESRELGFPLTVAAVVVLGIILVVAARASREAQASPVVGDHWHAAYAIYDCDTFLDPFISQSDNSGFHSHQDGVIHIEPRSGASSGENAQISVFLEAVGSEISEDGITGSGLDLPPGTDCNGEPTVIRAALFDVFDLDAGPLEEFTSDLGDVRFLENPTAITLARIPVGAEIPPPPDDRIAQAASSAGIGLPSQPPAEFDPDSVSEDAPDGTGADDPEAGADGDGTDVADDPEAGSDGDSVGADDPEAGSDEGDGDGG